MKNFDLQCLQVFFIENICKYISFIEKEDVMKKELTIVELKTLYDYCVGKINDVMRKNMNIEKPSQYDIDNLAKFNRWLYEINERLERILEKEF